MWFRRSFCELDEKCLQTLHNILHLGTTVAVWKRTAPLLVIITAVNLFRYLKTEGVRVGETNLIPKEVASSASGHSGQSLGSAQIRASPGTAWPGPVAHWQHSLSGPSGPPASATRISRPAPARACSPPGVPRQGRLGDRARGGAAAVRQTVRAPAITVTQRHPPASGQT